MKRQKNYHPLNNNDKDDFRLQKMLSPKYENAIEAEVRDGETLQSIALRFHCTIAEIKRLNKIDKDNEIYARKTIKVPLNPHSVLLETLPDVHKSGQSSPKHNNSSTEEQMTSLTTVTTAKQKMMSKTATIPITKLTESQQELSLNHKNLNEKLLIVSVNTSQILNNNEKQQKLSNNDNTINHIILNSTVKSTAFNNENGFDNFQDDLVDLNDQNTSNNTPLLSDIPNKTVLQPGRLPVSTKSILDCSGSDCDISWICLFVCILALCFAIPIIYVLYIAEHPEKFHNSN